MSKKSRLDRVFARLLMNHPYGWALYKKVTVKNLRPGAFGYFDADGDWHTLANLSGNQQDLVKLGLNIPDEPVKSSSQTPETLIWGPKSSTSVISREVGGEVGAPVVAAPIEASIKLSFQCGSDEGAVLVTQSPVLKHQIEDESAAVQWVEDNTADILKKHKAIIERHGIWVVTKTYTTQQCAVAVMSSKSSAVEIGIAANVPGVLTLSPSGKWSSSTGDAAFEIHQDEEGVVTFISGVYFSKRLIGSKLKQAHDQEDQKDKILRGHEDEIQLGNEEHDEEVFELQLFNCLDD
ncbi:hypothetical protein BGZ63DRAFT_426245 [Mariannaea sp. PMI_226]|nr:hypothetical protein BGZ63DRAFT_426245 [Mariannaea sp. PMI_226]